MPFIIENRYIQPAITLLDNLPLSGAFSRARTRFITQLATHLTALQEAEYALVAEHATTNTGEPIIEADGTFTFASPENVNAFCAEHATLLAERALIETEAYEGHHDLVRQALENTDAVFTGVEAVAYDALLTTLENTAVGGEDGGSAHQA
ncbi:hypothetical protein NXS08_03150 [Gleimia sp. 6138-11-ORH1]|uniref:hypothetical protein n=1 Tax=Gleimia sp. 6138-11-ORH1 TaxID=2973937 RepID=UPI0021680EE0|nr:hypothetical protein [Gleimia sp. 6138-11-ORH1]MCS4484486.1 hypothetical protein [Gleimia sp. 6138-11-ORH1]